MKKIVIVPFMFLALAGCAGRAPQPIAVATSQDDSLSCSSVRAEIDANNARMQSLAAEKGVKLTQNVAAGVVGLVFFPAWFLMDFQDAAGTELQSLNARQTYLGELAGQKCARRITK